MPATPIDEAEITKKVAAQFGFTRTEESYRCSACGKAYREKRIMRNGMKLNETMIHHYHTNHAPEQEKP